MPISDLGLYENYLKVQVILEKLYGVERKGEGTFLPLLDVVIKNSVYRTSITTRT